MKLGFIITSDHDPRNVRSWSGTPYHMARAFRKEGIELDHVGPLATRFRGLLRARAALQRNLGSAYLYHRDPIVVHGYAREIESLLAGLDIDALFSPSTIPISCLDVEVPLVTWTDATFGSMVDYYPSFSGLCKASVRAGHMMEREALARVGAALYSSTWAARSAVEDYGTKPERVHVVPFGANLVVEPTQTEVLSFIHSRGRNECRLLFFGVEWFRKGGDLALAVASRLQELGIPTKLTVIGSQVPEGADSHLVRGVGFVDKSTASGEATISHLLGESHFLCLPSLADCTPIVLSEAAAHGLPSVSIRTGGIGSVLSHGINGYLFEKEVFVERAAESIAACMADFDGTYVPLAMASYEEYCVRLNWRSSAKAFVEHVSGLVDAG